VRIDLVGLRKSVLLAYLIFCVYSLSTVGSYVRMESIVGNTNSISYRMGLACATTSNNASTYSDF
jgi:hypothetical protein